MARSFNGTSDFISLGNPTALQIPNGAGALSCACWVYATTLVPTADTFCVARDDNTLGRNFAFGIHAFAGPIWSLYLEIAGQPTADPGGNFTPNTWHHLGFSSTNSTVQAYADGVQVFNGAVGATPQVSTGNTTIGDRTYASFNQWFGGRIADVGFWNVILTASEMAALFSGARPGTIRPQSLVGWVPIDGLQSPEPDLSGHGNNGTLTGTAAAAGPPVALFTPRWPQYNFVPVVAGASMIFQQITQINFTANVIASTRLTVHNP